MTRLFRGSLHCVNLARSVALHNLFHWLPLLPVVMVWESNCLLVVITYFCFWPNFCWFPIGLISHVMILRHEGSEHVSLLFLHEAFHCPWTVFLSGINKISLLRAAIALLEGCKIARLICPTSCWRLKLDRVGCKLHSYWSNVNSEKWDNRISCMRPGTRPIYMDDEEYLKLHS